MPILELRVRKGRRRNGVQVAVASSHPSALDRDAAATVRFAPGSGEAVLAALAAALGSDRAPSASADDPVPPGEGVTRLPAGDIQPEELPHGDPVGRMDAAATEPDPGAPAPISGPGGEPGAMAGGPPGEQSEEGERPSAGVDTSSGDSGYQGGESAPESGADAGGGDPDAAGGERGVGQDDQTSSVGASATQGGEAPAQTSSTGSGSRSATSGGQSSGS